MHFIMNHFIAFPCAGQDDVGELFWFFQRNETQRLEFFEKLAWKIIQTIFLGPSSSFDAIDDYLYCTRSRDNQVETLSARKADKEGHIADAICNAQFYIRLRVRFTHREEGQKVKAKILLQYFTENRSDLSLSGLIATTDSVYGSTSLLKILLSARIGSIIIMPKNLKRCNLLAGKSFLGTCREKSSSNDAEKDPANRTSEQDVSVGDGDTHLESKTGNDNDNNEVVDERFTE